MGGRFGGADLKCFCLYDLFLWGADFKGDDRKCFTLNGLSVIVQVDVAISIHFSSVATLRMPNSISGSKGLLMA